MSVVSIHEVPDNRDGTVGTTVDQLDVNRRWRITVNSRQDGYFNIINDPMFWGSDIPKFFGTPHPQNLVYRSRRTRVEPDGESPLHWYATAEYSAAPFSDEEREKTETPNPLDRRTRFSVDFAEFQRYATQDLEGSAYENSAGEPYPAQPIDDGRFVIRMRKNVTQWQGSWFTLRNTLNQSAVTVNDGFSFITIPAEKGLLKGPRLSELAEENGVFYYTLTAEVHVVSEDEPDGWKLVLMDQGFNYMDADDEFKLKRIVVVNPVTDEKEPCVSEQYLDGMGAPLYEDGIYNPSLEPYKWEFVKHKTKSWSGLPFFTT